MHRDETGNLTKATSAGARRGSRTMMSAGRPKPITRRFFQEGNPMNAKSATLASDVGAAVSEAISDAEEMLAEAASSTGEKAAELRRKALEQLIALRASLRDASLKAVDQSKAAARATDDYVHDHPWRAIGVAACMGVVIGMLIARR
jgi:ElaB/YqjD/DUF883 family membrane-anchored ribosome-binding protein